MAAPKKAPTSRTMTLEDSSGMFHHVNLDDCYICANALVNKFTDRHILIVVPDDMERVIEAFHS